MAFDYLGTVLPTGVTPGNLVCVYQFDGPTNGLNDRSGNGHHLEAIGGTAVWSRIDASGVVVVGSNRWLRTIAAQTGVFNTLGELTVEWIARKWLYGTSNRHHIFAIGENSSTTQALNLTVDLYSEIVDSGIHYVARHERGAGVDEEVQFDWGEPFPCLHHGALTRAADGVTYRLYSDGQLLQTLVASNPPDGGDGSIRLYVGGAGTTDTENYGYMSSFRYVKERLSDAQILESHNAVHVS